MKKPESPPLLTEALKKMGTTKALASYFNRADVQETVREANHRYVHWDTFRRWKIPIHTTHELLWLLVKMGRAVDANKINLGRKQNFTFSYSITDEALRKLHEFDFHLGGILGGKPMILKEHKERYLISSLMEEAIASSQLEGAATTWKVAKDMLRKERKPRNTSERMIANNYQTIRKILKLKGEKITKEILLDIHKTITKETLEKTEDEGCFRKNNDVQVVDAVTGTPYYYPPDFKNVPELIDRFLLFANEKEKNRFIHPLVKASILHFLIGYVHPFADGNGRVARAVFYWYALSQGYWLLEFLSISRAIKKSPVQYAQAYLHTESDENDLTYFINYQLKTLDVALKELKKYLERKIREKSELFRFLKIKHINNRQAQLLKEFYDDPEKVMTIYEAKNVFDVTYQTARIDLLQLEKRDFLRKKTGDRKRMLFYRSREFEEKLKRVENGTKKKISAR